MPTILSCNGEEASRLITDHLIATAGFTPAGDTGSTHGAGPFPVFANKDGWKIVRYTHPDPAIVNQVVHTDFLSFLEADLFIFPDSHASAAGRPALTVHPVGNWTQENKLGGLPGKLGLSSAVAMSAAFSSYRRAVAAGVAEGKGALSGFELTLEATHHGPTELRAPVVFVEIGITPAEWTRPDAIQAASNAVLEACKAFAHKKKPDGKVAIGFGGPHYCNAFNDLHGTQFSFSHVAAKYALDSLTPELIKHAVARTVEPVEAFVVDWKGMKLPHRELVKKMADELGVEFVRA